MSEKLEWRANTPALLKEIANNNPGMWMLAKPIQIFALLLEEVATRASELNDPVMNRLMSRLALYEAADPYSPGYDPEVCEQIEARYREYIASRSAS